MPLAAILGVVGSVAGAAVSAHATNKASDAASAAAAANNKLISNNFNTTVGLEQPAINRGNAAGDALAALLNIGGDPAKQSAAFQQYLHSTGYEFQLGQGLDAVTQSRALQGSLDSGGTMKALNDYAQGQASHYFDTYTGSLNALAGQGVNAVGQVANAGQNATNAGVSNNNQQAETTANAALAGAGNINSLISGALGAVAFNKGASSYGAPPANTQGGRGAAGGLPGGYDGG